MTSAESIFKRYTHSAPERTARFRERAEACSRLAPELRRKILGEAELAMKHQWILPGTGGRPAPIGNPPEWHEMIGNDDSSLWGRNRMQWWTSLLRAYWLADEPAFAAEVARQFADWVLKCPPPVIEDSLAVGEPMRDERIYIGAAITPWRTLEVGIRMFDAWPDLFDNLLGTPFLDESTFAAGLECVIAHGRILRAVAPRLWPEADHNHYFMQMLGLLAVSCQFPELPQASDWRAFAVRELERCTEAQFTDEGGHIEGCPHYHNLCVKFACCALEFECRWGGELDFAFSDAFRDRTRRAVRYSFHATRPSGTGVPWGDSDANDFGLMIAALPWWLVSGEEEILWNFSKLLGRDTVRKKAVHALVWKSDTLPELKSPPKAAQPPLVYWVRNLKQVMLRSSWERDALSVFFACRTPVYNVHAHIDPAGFDFTALGMPMVVDPGRFCYRDDEDRKAFKSPEYHNTITIDGKPPFTYLHHWGLGPQREGEIAWVRENDPHLLAAECWHDNFSPVRHRRMVALVNGSALLVLDRLENIAPEASVQRYFHFDTPALTQPGARSWRAAFGETRLDVLDSCECAWRILPGRVSDVGDVFRPSARLCLEDVGTVADTRFRCYATLFVPDATEQPGGHGVELKTPPDALGMEVILRSGQTSLIRWETGQGVSSEMIG